MDIVRTASVPPWTRNKAMGKALLSYLISHVFVGIDHERACIWTRVCNGSFKTIYASATIFELGIVITLFVLWCMLNYLWTYVTCGLYVESCLILVVWLDYSRSFMILDGLPGLYGLKYDSAIVVGWLPLYLCSYKLVGSATVQWMAVQWRGQRRRAWHARLL